MLRYPLIEKIPQAITLRTGLAVSFAVEEFMPELSGMVMIKWPNDIMINSKKTAGILCEADVSSKDGWIVHAGIGINVSQKEFPSGLKEKATSISLASGQDIDPDKRFSLLEKILHKLYHELEAPDWRARLDPSANYGVEGPPGGVSGVQRLYKKNEKIIFMEGEAGSGMEIKGRIDGIGENGELMIIPDGKEEACPFITGEIVLEG
jgi:BirA family biotin operon repressor/biotin-[acetyl-CoA-carboxylase] ligase